MKKSTARLTKLKGKPVRMAGSGKLELRQRICFVTETGRGDRPILDPSVRYRCYHFAEELSKSGYIVSIYSAKQFYSDIIADYDTYIFHRPNIGRLNFERTVMFLQQQGRRIIADYDDLIFGDAETALESSAVKNGTLTPPLAIAAFSSCLRAMDLFDHFTASTEPLAKQIRRHRPEAMVAITPNFLPNALVEMHQALGTPDRPRYGRNIGYFAGTKSHNLDFPIVAPALARFLSEDRRIHFTAVGPVELPGSIASLPNVRQMGAVAYSRLPDLMSGFATVIAPLEKSLFNECKSRVKFLEACLAGCRLVATPIPDMVTAGNDSLAFANNDDDWYENLLTEVATPSDSEQSALCRLIRDHNASVSVQQLENVFS